MSATSKPTAKVVSLPSMTHSLSHLPNMPSVDPRNLHYGALGGSKEASHAKVSPPKPKARRQPFKVGWLVCFCSFNKHCNDGIRLLLHMVAAATVKATPSFTLCPEEARVVMITITSWWARYVLGTAQPSFFQTLISNFFLLCRDANRVPLSFQNQKQNKQAETRKKDDNKKKTPDRCFPTSYHATSCFRLFLSSLSTLLLSNVFLSRYLVSPRSVSVSYLHRTGISFLGLVFQLSLFPSPYLSTHLFHT